MADENNPLIPALRPLTRRVRRDVTACKRADGVQAWTREPLTLENLAKHLNGGPARGVSFIKPGESVTLVALLDFDSHGGETPWGEMCAVAGAVTDALVLAWGAEPLAFRSSGGRGIHLYLVWDEPQDARSVRHWLAGILHACGLKPGTKGVQAGQVEVFPKQDAVPAGGFGNQVILPLANRSELLELCDLSGCLIPAGRILTAEDWRASPPVPPAPARDERAASAVTPDGAWVRALAALTNTGAKELAYDEWRNVMFAIHHETQGEGLALAHEFSARSSKYTPEFLDTRVWPYIEPGKGITGRTIMSLAARLEGWSEPLDETVFPVVADTPPAVGVSAPPEAPEGIPRALHLCTDQANAARLVAHYGAKVLVAGGRWHAWDGARWEADDADVYRMGCRLSTIVKSEAATIRARAQTDGGDTAKAADTLEKWSTKCEMKGTIEAAIGLAKKMMGVPAETLDADPWLLNVRNGVVDLRTGKLGPHRPELRMSRFVDIDYDSDARCDAWENALLQITREDAPGQAAPVAGFLRRWFGYCLTGHTREQVFVTHWGDGGNGKSVIIDLMARTAGDYSISAPPGMVAASRYDSIKDTELAVLRGRRAVTAHETKQGVELREDFVKLATGSDRITARHLYGDAFEFSPTHKLQLLTNHKPIIKSMDRGTWRRIVLVPYAAAFGDFVGQVLETGAIATHVRDDKLLEVLSTPEALAGILAWRVRGAVEWAQHGLQIPDVVRAASHEYQSEMDRVGQFVAECCEIGPGFSEPLTLGMVGLYPAYVSWCKEGGVHALSRTKFLIELRRAVAGCEEITKTERTEVGRRSITRIRGLRLLAE